MATLLARITDPKMIPWITATLFWILLVGLVARLWYLHQNTWYSTLLIFGMLVAAFIAGEVIGSDIQFKTAIGSLMTNIRRSGHVITFLCVLTASLIWWRYLAQNNIESVPLIVAISLAGFIVGALIGVLFSSYSAEEEKSIGKIRDWLLAGITGACLRGTSCRCLLTTPHSRRKITSE